MILALVFLSLCPMTIASPTAESSCSRERLISSGGDEDGPAPPLGPDELDSELQLGELRECFGVTPANTEDQGKEEGDMIRVYNASAPADGAKLSGLAALRRRWPGGRIPYELSGDFGSRARKAIGAAFEQLKDATCIRVVQREPGDDDYIRIRAEDGCWSYLGRVGGRQTVSLGEGCVYNGIILHELLHAAGFVHEHSRPDRDRFVRILYRNIQPGLEDQFEKHPRKDIAELEVGYDYGSIMHYRPNAFSRRRNRLTIEALKPGGQELMGQRDRLSAKDIRKINKLYNCQDGKAATTTTPKPASECENIWACGWFTWACDTKWYRNMCPETCGVC